MEQEQKISKTDRIAVAKAICLRNQRVADAKARRAYAGAQDQDAFTGEWAEACDACGVAVHASVIVRLGGSTYCKTHAVLAAQAGR